MALRATLVVAAAIAGAQHAHAQLDPSACTTASGLSFAYDLAVSCYKGTAQHQDSGGNAETVRITVDFPLRNPTQGVSDSQTPSRYYIAVFDPAQGSDAAADFQFGTSPAITPLQSGAATTFSGLNLYTKTSTGFSSTTRAYVYATVLTMPAGGYEVSFVTRSSLTTRIDYIVAVMEMDVSAGHLAYSGIDGTSVGYTFGSASPVKHVPLGLSSSCPSLYLAASGYGPGSDGRLVESMTTHLNVPGGAEATGVQASGDTSVASSSSFVSTLADMASAYVPLPPAVFPRTYSGSEVSQQPRPIRLTWSLSCRGTTNGVLRSVDITASPGPFLAFQPGGDQDEVKEAARLSSNLDISFDARPRGTGDSRATLNYRLMRIDVPSRWWSIRLSASATTVDGAHPGKTARLLDVMGRFAYGGQSFVSKTARPVSPDGITSNVLSDDSEGGAWVIPNTAIGTLSGREPLGAIGDPSGWSVNTWPRFDSRAQTRPVYVLLCRTAACNDASTATGVTQTTVALRVLGIATFPGECDSDADCAAVDGPHPAQDRAAWGSANGDANRLTTCSLFAGPSGRLPETRCVECYSDCDCNPGQFCYAYTGLSATSTGVHAVVDELSRLRAGLCMRKDPNGTQFGRRCRQAGVSGSPSVYYTDSPRYTFQSGASPFVVGQTGGVPCAGLATIRSNPSDVGLVLNTTGQPVATLWEGECDAEGMCRECLTSTPTSVRTQCSNRQVCLDGYWFRTWSVDQTIRTFTTDTRAGTLLTLVFIGLFALSMMLWTFCSTCCAARRAAKGGASACFGCCAGSEAVPGKSGSKPAGDDTTSTNPALASRRGSAAPGATAGGATA